MGRRISSGSHSRANLTLRGLWDEKQLTKPRKTLARAKLRLLTVVLYARRADRRSVVHWARAAERALPDQTEFCFSATEVARALKLRSRTRAATRRSPDDRQIDIAALRTALRLTQAQLAVAIGVSERTVQNWESGRVSPQAERRLEGHEARELVGCHPRSARPETGWLGKRHRSRGTCRGSVNRPHAGFRPLLGKRSGRSDREDRVIACWVCERGC